MGMAADRVIAVWIFAGVKHAYDLEWPNCAAKASARWRSPGRPESNERNLRYVPTRRSPGDRCAHPAESKRSPLPTRHASAA